MSRVSLSVINASDALWYIRFVMIEEVYPVGRVYKIANDVDNLVYVGSTSKSLDVRMHQHHCDARKGCQRRLQMRIRSYGIEHFMIELLDEVKWVTRNELAVHEQKRIIECDSVAHGLNTKYEDRRKGVKHRCEHQVRILKCRYCNPCPLCPGSAATIEHMASYFCRKNYAEFLKTEYTPELIRKANAISDAHKDFERKWKDDKIVYPESFWKGIVK